MIWKSFFKAAKGKYEERTKHIYSSKSGFKTFIKISVVEFILGVGSTLLTLFGLNYKNILDWIVVLLVLAVSSSLNIWGCLNRIKFKVITIFSIYTIYAILALVNYNFGNISLNEWRKTYIDSENKYPLTVMIDNREEPIPL
ncbi:MAG: hypothetical protein N2749_07125 [Clostridia bacterium]|nr:hypothetical protein [Clostridia bacterium]